MNCATCKHWNPKGGDPAMAKHRLAICDLGKRYEYLPPQATCERHERAPEPIVKARTAWLTRGRSAPDAARE